MKRKFVLPVVMALLCVMCLQAQQPKMKPGVERWPIKTSAPKLKESPKDVSFNDLIGLPDPPGVLKNDKRYQKALIPHFDNSLNVDEGQILRVSGWLHLVAFESDGDYHIQISNSDTSGNHCLIVEVPYPNYVKSSKALKKLCATVRDFIKKNLLNGKDPSSEGTILKKPAYVTITGQLFYDDFHVGDPPRGKQGMHAATLWEIHPVIAIDTAKAQ